MPRKIPVFNIGKRTFNALTKDENGKDKDLEPKRSVGIEERKARILLKAYPRDLSTTGLDQHHSSENHKKANELKKKESELNVYKKALEDAEKAFSKRVEELKLKEKALEDLEKVLEEKEKDLNEFEKVLESRKIENKEGDKNAKS